MGKASKRKSDRRTGAGPSRTEAESKVRQEQVRRRLTAVLSEPGQLSDMLREVARQAAAAQATTADAVTGPRVVDEEPGLQVGGRAQLLGLTH